MSDLPRRFVLGLALAVCLPLVALAATATQEDFSLGNPKAPVTVIEYASASCPHCARFNNDVFPDFKAKYVDTGKVHYVFREFLTDPVDVAAAAFLTARCAGADNYFKVLDAFFHGQQHMYETGDVHAALNSAGAVGGLSEQQVMDCVADDAAAKALNDRVDHYIKDDHIEATPTFVIGDQRLQGEQTLDSLDKAIAAAEPKPKPKHGHAKSRRQH
jgi:protein-disulfide isomerase